ncbi:MAG: rod shape-determining protein MreD [Chlorobi bacterium]|nr:rod shape-determining protein MreD [Chlorobiota bacterium]
MTLNVLLKNAALFLLLIFLQIFLFDNIKLTSYEVRPLFYVLFILLLPFDISGWALLLSAFFTGLILDMFEDTGGVHAASLLIAAFLRPMVLRILSTRDGYLPDTSPSITLYGFSWFLKYAFILALVHNAAYYIFLKFGFQDFSQTLIKTITASVTVSALIILSQFLFAKR